MQQMKSVVTTDHLWPWGPDANFCSVFSAHSGPFTYSMPLLDYSSQYIEVRVGSGAADSWHFEMHELVVIHIHSTEETGICSISQYIYETYSQLICQSSVLCKCKKKQTQNSKFHGLTSYYIITLYINKIFYKTLQETCLLK